MPFYQKGVVRIHYLTISRPVITPYRPNPGIFISV